MCHTGIFDLLLALASASFCFLLAAALLALSFGSSKSSLISIVSMKSLHIGTFYQVLALILVILKTSSVREIRGRLLLFSS